VLKPTFRHWNTRQNVTFYRFRFSAGFLESLFPKRCTLRVKQKAVFRSGSRTGKRLRQKVQFTVFLRWYYPVQVRRVCSQPSHSDESERDAPLTELPNSNVEKNYLNIQPPTAFVKSAGSLTPATRWGMIAIFRAKRRVPITLPAIYFFSIFCSVANGSAASLLKVFLCHSNEPSYRTRLVQLC